MRKVSFPVEPFVALHRFTARCAVWLFLCGVPSWGSAQARRCAIRGQLQELGENGYRARGARCEGIVAQDVSADIIQIAGFTSHVEDFDPNRGTDLHVTWAPVVSDSIWLMATGVRPRLFYQMDTAVPASSTEFVWPVSVLGAEDIRRGDLTLLAWTNERVGGASRRVLVPVAVWQQSPPPFAESHRTLIVVPAQRLSALRLGIAAVDSTGRTTAHPRALQGVPGNDFPQGQPVYIPLTELELDAAHQKSVSATSTRGQAAFYRIELAGDLVSSSGRSGGVGVPPTTTEAIVRIPPD